MESLMKTTISYIWKYIDEKKLCEKELLHCCLNTILRKYEQLT